MRRGRVIGEGRMPHIRTAVVVVAVVWAIVLPAGPSSANEPDGGRGLDFRCRLIATKLGEEITVTFRLRTNQPRDDWRVRLFHEGERFFSKVRTTNAVGRLRVVRVVPNLAGRDDLAAVARHLETGRTCKVATRI